MSKEYIQLKDIKLQDILDLNKDAFRSECLDRLEGCGFIEEKKLYYKFGQRFRYNGEEYVLAFLKDHQAALVNIRTGWTWSGVKSVQDNMQITQTELDALGGGADRLEPVK